MTFPRIEEFPGRPGWAPLVRRHERAVAAPTVAYVLHFQDANLMISYAPERHLSFPNFPPKSELKASSDLEIDL